MRPRALRPAVLALCAALPCAGLAFSACGGTSAQGDGGMPQRDGSFDAGHLDEPWVLEAACRVTVWTPPDRGNQHLPIGTLIDYPDNPPASGPHYPIWASYQEYDAAVPRPYWVHSLEHGAVVFAYRCDDGGCAETKSTLRAAIAAMPDDPICRSAGEGVRVRAILTEDPLLDVPVAAAAWGWHYRAECADLPTLTWFAKARQAKGPENLCGNGTTSFVQPGEAGAD